MSEPEPKNPHDNLLFFGILLAVGIIIIIASLSSFLKGGWEDAIVGAIFAGVGGFELKINIDKISNENKSITATQSGVANNQVNVTNPHSSPTIGKVEHYYANVPAQVDTSEDSEDEPETKVPPRKSRKAATAFQAQTVPQSTQGQGNLEEIYRGDSRFDEFQDFEVSVRKGDRINFTMRGAQPISVHIVPSEYMEDFGSSAYYAEEMSLWESPKGKNVSFSWLAKKNGTVYVVIVNETDLDEWEDGEADVDVTINAVRMNGP